MLDAATMASLVTKLMLSRLLTRTKCPVSLIGGGRGTATLTGSGCEGTSQNSSTGVSSALSDAGSKTSGSTSQPVSTSSVSSV